MEGVEYESQLRFKNWFVNKNVFDRNSTDEMWVVREAAQQHGAAADKR